MHPTVNKLLVILWKVFILRKRHWILTICEFLFPILLFTLVAYGRSNITDLSKENVTVPTYNEPKDSKYIFDRYNDEMLFYYAPNNKFIEELILRFQLKLEIKNNQLQGFSSEKFLLDHYQSHGTNNSVIAIIFKDIKPSEIPKKLNYNIRSHFKTSFWDTNHLFGSLDEYVPDSGSDMYIYKGFLTTQWALDEAYIELVSGENKLPFEITIQELPFPPYVKDEGLNLVAIILPLTTILSFALLCPDILKRVIEEKSTGTKEYMKIMGLKKWMILFGWFIYVFIINFISVLIIVIMIKNWGHTPLIEFSNGVIIFLFLILYCITSILLCFAVSTFFNKANIAVIFGVLLWLLTYAIPQSFISNMEESNYLYFSAKVLLGLFPNIALLYGYNAIFLYEKRGIGSQWGNLFSPADGYNSISVGHVFEMFILESIIFILITIYMDNVNPGKFGLARSFDYPIKMLRHFINTSLLNKVDTEEVLNDPKSVATENFERAYSNHYKSGITLRNLSKCYGTKSAVNDVNLNIYEGQITALLGHNGAGKTTTMSMITGLIRPSKGEVFICDHNIKNLPAEIKNSVGICPQHNMLFSEFTCKEHLLFFGMLKGLSYSEANQSADVLLKKLNLYNSRNYFPNQISGGMKRKLSLGLALIGNSKVLILDEPTSGMDTEARKEMWDMLKTFKESRTVLLTTHYMEEADALADQIAIMDHGCIICYGTPMFLKKKFGTGYHLSLIYEESYSNLHKNGESENLAELIKSKVLSTIEGAEFLSHDGNNLIFSLPSRQKEDYPQLLQLLESKEATEMYGIMNISLSNTSLEDVFIKVGQITEDENLEVVDYCDPFVNQDFTNYQPKKHEIMLRKILALFEKRNIVFKRKIYLHLTQIIISFLIIFITLYMGTSSPKDIIETSLLNCELNIYGPTKVYYSNKLHDPKFSEIYNDLIKNEHSDAISVNDVNDAVINEGIKNIIYYKHNIVVAAEFNSTKGTPNINALYSNVALHGAPISLNLVMNTVLKYLLNDSYSISTTNYPLETFHSSVTQEQSIIQISTLWLFLFPLGLLFLVTPFLIFPYMEIVSNIKRLQCMCGIYPILYWLVNFIFDVFIYIITIIIIVSFIALYGLFSDVNIFGGYKELDALFTICILYGLSSIPFVYLFCHKKTISSGFSSLIVINLIFGIVITLVIIAIEETGIEKWEKTAHTLHYFFMFIPQYSLSYISVQFCRKAVWKYNWELMATKVKQSLCIDNKHHCCGPDLNICYSSDPYFKTSDGSILNLSLMGLSAILYLTILSLIDSYQVKKQYYFLTHLLKRFGKSIFSKPSTTTRNYNTCNKEDTEGLLNVKKILKYYDGTKKVVDIDFSVHPGECFGLLGVNGAGKSTTFRILTGEEPANNGNATIKHVPDNKEAIDLCKNHFEYQEKIGYCPQYDSINEVLSGRETLTLFAKIRGVPPENINNEVNKWINLLGLTEYADIPSGKYSGGNKRKLNFGISIIGNPLITFLDEPTSGVDPVSRRKLWNVIKKVKSNKSGSVILSSHSMEECEALCNKLGILKNGELEALDTIPNLKKKYGKGFTVTLKLKQPKNDNEDADEVDSMRTEDSHELLHVSVDNVEVLQSKIKNKFGKDNVTFFSNHVGLINFHIDIQQKWSDIFMLVECFKEENSSIVEDYVINETTLEEIFLSFAKNENEEV